MDLVGICRWLQKLWKHSLKGILVLVQYECSEYAMTKGFRGWMQQQELIVVTMMERAVDDYNKNSATYRTEQWTTMYLIIKNKITDHKLR